MNRDLIPPSFFEHHPGLLPTGVVSIVECVDEDGDPELVWFCDEQTAPWKAKGMLQMCQEDLRFMVSDFEEDD